MLIPYLLRKDDIVREMTKRWYDPAYQYYYWGVGRDNYLAADGSEPDEYYNRRFASVDKCGFPRGYIAYSINYESMSCTNFGAMSFTIGDVEFARDVLLCIAECFFKYNCNRIEWRCFVDNPAIESYRILVSRFGGREVATLRQVARLLDGKLHDEVIFEITKDSINLDGSFAKRLRDRVLKGGEHNERQTKRNKRRVIGTIQDEI